MVFLAQPIVSDTVGLIARIYGGLLSGYIAGSAVYDGKRGWTKSWVSDEYWAGICFIQAEKVLVMYCRNSGSILIS